MCSDIYTSVYIRKIKEIIAMNFRESKVENIQRFGGKKGKGHII